MSAITPSALLHRHHRRISRLLPQLMLSALSVVLLSNFLSTGFFSTQQASAQSAAASSVTCHNAGVTKNSNGSYSFSWLHVDSRTGYIMDQHNCIVDLRGFNTTGTEYGDAVSGFPGLTPQRLTWFNRTFKMNYIRLNLNVGWWNSNVYVPNAQMHYRAWIEKWISWAKQNGDYVLLNRTNEYQIPPCGGSNTYCPSQAERSDIDDAYPQKQFNAGHLLSQTLSFWQSITAIYKNDPAILYDDWNELHDINAQTWLKVQTKLITFIRSINPRSLIVLGSNDWNNTMSPLTSGQVSDLRYSNLVYDWHIYDGKSGKMDGIPCVQGTSYMWAHWGAISNRQFIFAHQHGHGAMINEWGGCIDDSRYNTALSSYAASHHIGMAYFWAGNVVNDTWNGLNANGKLAQAAYARF